MTSYSLFELHEYIRRIVALNLPDAVWLHAEVAEVDERRGHYYLTLVEKGEDNIALVARGQAMMWDSAARAWQRKQRLLLKELLQPGRSVKLQIQTEFHERYGLKFNILDIDPDFTLGQLEQLRQATLAHLQLHGLLQTNKSLSLSVAPQRLAIISSPAAAGLQDFLAQLNHNAYGYQFRSQLFPAAVQGTQASPEIRRQLRTIERRKEDFDAIIIIRGGGSRTDLADFDEQALCIAAAEASLPILTGIGHETDLSILDMVAHTSLKTPTAVADFLVDRLLHFEQRVLVQEQYLFQFQHNTLQNAAFKLEQYQQRLTLLQQQLLRRQLWQLEQFETQLPQLVHRRLKSAGDQLLQLEKLLQLLSLGASLGRGFSIVSQNGKIINSAAALKYEEELNIYFKDGEVKLKIEPK